MKMVSEAKNYTKLEGKYTVVGLDIDTTGRRLIDEVGFEKIPKWRLLISFSFLFLFFNLIKN